MGCTIINKTADGRGKNMKYIKNGRIILPDGEVKNKVLAFNDSIIGVFDETDMEPDAEVIDAEGGIVSPGLIDLHIHGYMGEDASDGSEAGLVKISNALTQNGVTAWLPTTMTIPTDELNRAFGAVRSLMKNGHTGAVILGVHAEGPYISPKKCGAQKPVNIKKPDADFILANKDVIRIVTMAPELEGAPEAAERVSEESDIVISMGHTDASYAQACRGAEAGFSHATHLFNAMTGLHHRDPGAVGAALTHDKVSCELIADEFHVSPELFGLLYKLKKDRLVLITDCTRAGGLSDGQYDLGGQRITVSGIECRLDDGTIAGSVLKLNRALYNFKKNTGLDDWQVIATATQNPAMVLNDDSRGRLEKGKRADIVIFDGDYNVKKTFIAGKEVGFQI